MDIYFCAPSLNMLHVLLLHLVIYRVFKNAFLLKENVFHKRIGLTCSERGNHIENKKFLLQKRGCTPQLNCSILYLALHSGPLRLLLVEKNLLIHSELNTIKNTLFFPRNWHRVYLMFTCEKYVTSKISLLRVWPVINQNKIYTYKNINILIYISTYINISGCF